MFSKKLKIEALLSVIVVVALFILTSYFVKQNIEYLEETIGDNEFGMVIYFLLTIVAVVIAPVSDLPLLAAVAQIYGVVEAAIATWLAWIIGSVIIFYLGRKYGVGLVKNFISLEEVYEIEERIIPKKHMFWNLLLLRMIIPVELLSYALALFSRVDFKTYLITAMIGLLPIAFLFSYLGVIPLAYQVLIFTTLILTIILIHLLRELWAVSRKNF